MEYDHYLTFVLNVISVAALTCFSLMWFLLKCDQIKKAGLNRIPGSFPDCGDGSAPSDIWARESRGPAGTECIPYARQDIRLFVRYRVDGWRARSASSRAVR
jgi:hypothetical protein